MNVNIWLPSLSELVGIDSARYNAMRGAYSSAMQELNTTADWYTDVKGGEQFAYFTLFNASGGGQAIWSACNQQQSWLRSSSCDHAHYTWQTTSAQRFDWVLPDSPRTVHPAVEWQIRYKNRKQAWLPLLPVLIASGITNHIEMG